MRSLYRTTHLLFALLFVLLALLAPLSPVAHAQDIPISSQFTCEHQLVQTSGLILDTDGYIAFVYDGEGRYYDFYFKGDQGNGTALWVGDMFKDGFTGDIDILYGYFGGASLPAQRIHICDDPNHTFPPIPSGFLVFMPLVIK